MRWFLVSAAMFLLSCASDTTDRPNRAVGGKADGLSREIRLVLTNPFCDVCTSADKDVLRERSETIRTVIELIDAASASTPIRIAQFTFSVREIEDALLRAHGRGVPIRIAMDAAQDQDGSLSRRLRDAGLEVRFVSGGGNGSHAGLQHAKFMLVGDTTLFTGSNNWSSTGTTVNEENAILVRSDVSDPLLVGFDCHFEAIWSANVSGADDCSRDEITFGPGSRSKNMIRDAIRSAQTEIAVLMHHLTFDDLVKELAKAAERGVRVRVVVNAADRQEHTGSSWDRLIAAGGEIRYKQSNAGLYQLMHHKLAIVDDSVITGSGNWSGSGFFNNFENYVRYYDQPVVSAIRQMYERLWVWSLRGDSLDAGMTAAAQHAAETQVFFGNLHAHYAESAGEQLLDDGSLENLGAGGVRDVIVNNPDDSARVAFEYARDRGGLDFLALTPHCTDDRSSDGATQANMSTEGFARLRETANLVTEESNGTFLGLAGMEWSTNSAGNHVNVFGAHEIAKVERGRFDLLYNEFLADRVEAGEQPFAMLNHPRTFSMHEDNLEGSWDQIFGVNLLDIPNNSERKRKFNDYGLDDFAPLRDVHEAWVNGEVLPDEAVVEETLANLWTAASPYLRLMEVTLGRGNEFDSEVAQNPSISITEDGASERRTKVHTDWDYYLLRGFRLAPAASHDNHWANWGTAHTSRTGVIASALDEAGLLAAIGNRLVYASEDENLELRFYVDGRIPMGTETQTTSSRVRADVLLQDPDYSGDFSLTVHHGRVGGEITAEPAVVVRGNEWVTLELPTPTRGQHFFYVEVLEVDSDRMAWSAPVWIERL